MDIASLVIGVLSLLIGVASLIISWLSFCTVQKVDEEVRKASSKTLLRVRAPEILSDIQKARQALNAAQCGTDVKIAFSGALGSICRFMNSELVTDHAKEMFQKATEQIHHCESEPTTTSIYDPVQECINFLTFIETTIMTEG